MNVREQVSNEEIAAHRIERVSLQPMHDDGLFDTSTAKADSIRIDTFIKSIYIYKDIYISSDNNINESFKFATPTSNEIGRQVGEEVCVDAEKNTCCSCCCIIGS